MRRPPRPPKPTKPAQPGAAAAAPCTIAPGVAKEVTTVLEFSLNIWSATTAAPLLFHPVRVYVLHTDNKRYLWSFQICEDHLRACFPEVHRLFQTRGVFLTLPVPDSLRASLPTYVAECADIFMRRFPETPEAANPTAAFVAYVGCVVEWDVTGLMGAVLNTLTWYGLKATAEVHGMNDLVGPLHAARHDYQQLMWLRGVMLNNILNLSYVKRLYNL